MGTINKRNMNTLLFSQRGFVHEDLESDADEIVHLARENVRAIMQDHYRGNLDELLDSIDYEIIQRGFILEARIGIRDTGKASRYLASKEDREQGWLRPAVEEVMG